MKNKSVLSKCATFVMYASVSIALTTTIVSLIGQAVINYSSQTLRPLLQMLYDHNGLALLLSSFAGLIAINVKLEIALQQINAKEQHEKKYTLENQSNTKSRLELTRLRKG